MECEFQVPLVLDDFPPANKNKSLHALHQARVCIRTWKGLFQMPYQNVVATFALAWSHSVESPIWKGKSEGC